MIYGLELKTMITVCMITSESVSGVGTESSDSTVTQPQQSCVVSSDVDTQNDDVKSEARTSEVDTLEPIASQPPQSLVIDADITSRSDDVVTADSQLVQDDELGVPFTEAALDDSVYHDCISASFIGKLLLCS